MLSTSNEQMKTNSNHLNNLNKLMLIHSQIGHDNLMLFIDRLQNGFSGTDPLFDLWKLYHDSIAKIMPA